ncbi:redoxin domain-containing protein [Yinghuangia sp. YIM S09857]|uniref:redoxin domain-containing protein n=1 Tax=Yinghuangia sp. YIM S09857 TaxID=3436929 RepID=UPI003F53561D
MRVRLILALAALAALAAVSGCGSAAESGGPDGGTSPAAAAAPVPAPAAASPTGTPDLLVFTATTIDRKPFAGVTLLGRPAVLWFWSAAGPECRAQGAETDKAAVLFADRATVVGVAAAGDPAALREFVASTGVGALPHLTDASGDLRRRFGVTEPGTYVFLDAGGAVVHRAVLPRGEGLVVRTGELVR